jgi:hypothetical protein
MVELLVGAVLGTGLILVGWWLRGVTDYQKHWGTTEIPITLGRGKAVSEDEHPDPEFIALDKEIHG